jgi:endo-1,4-beta-xylanase
MEGASREEVMKFRRKYSRRDFMRASARAGAAAVVASQVPFIEAPELLLRARTRLSTAQGTLKFQPHYVQRGVGPHLLDWAYASDSNWDAFHSNITSSKEGVLISDTEGKKTFGVDVRWNVEGFGYIYITADNGGEFYELPLKGRERTLNLNFELAKSRVVRNRKRAAQFAKEGWTPSREVKALLDLSDELYEDAGKIRADELKRGTLSQQSLLYAMKASEAMELDKARAEIERRGYRPAFFFGCDARAFYQMYQDRFLEWFPELFNYAMITYVTKGDGMMSDFEPEEGKLNFATRDVLFHKLRKRGITVQGRTIFWFHTWVTPDWLKRKSFDELKKYVERHTREVVAHYPEGMYGWEIFNEFHDWANEVQVTPEEAVELVKLACDVAKDTNPNVHRIINNCCPYAEYVQLKQWSGQEAVHPQRTPWQFTRDLVEAGVDFTVLGQQMYFPYRDLQDIILSVERLAVFKKPIQMSEVGTPGGITNDGIKTGKVKFPDEPYIWRRYWDEELAADWLEGVYTLFYSKPYIESCSWFDFIDTTAYQQNGGLFRTAEGGQKAAWHRLKRLQDRWKGLPTKKG